jgi:hypothetical protein
MKKRYFTAAMATVAAAALIMGACSRSKTIETDEGKVTFTEKGDMVKIETEEGSLTIKGDQLNVQTEEGNALLSLGTDKLPEDLSKDVPIYKPSKVTMTQVMNEGKNTLLGLSTGDDATKVIAFYEKQMADNGWTGGRKLKMGNTAMMSGKKGDRDLSVTINHDDDITAISLVVVEED